MHYRHTIIYNTQKLHVSVDNLLLLTLVLRIDWLSQNLGTFGKLCSEYTLHCCMYSYTPVLLYGCAVLIASIESMSV